MSGFPLYNPTGDVPSFFTGVIPEQNSQPATSAPPLPILPTNGMVTPSPPAWYDFQAPPLLPLPAFQPPNQEVFGIKLVHALIECAESVQSGKFLIASTLVEKLHALRTLLDPSSTITKVAAYFIDALSRRVYAALGFGSFPMMASATDNDSSYHGFYEAAPFLKFAHFTANQAILEATNGRDCVHVIDLGTMQGLQWPVFIQTLAQRHGGPPALKITVVGLGTDSLSALGLKLAEVARAVNVNFEFQAVAVSRLGELKPEMLDLRTGEAVAVNSVFQLHKLIGSDVDPVNVSSVKTVLSWVRAMNPTIVTVVEQEADLNQLGFLDRFTSSLIYFSTIFDSLETCSAPHEKALAELYLQKEIVDVVCFEGSARVERYEPLAKWKARLQEAGFLQVYLGLDALTQAQMLLNLFAANGYCVNEAGGSLILGWHGLPLVTTSVWIPSFGQIGAVGDV